MSARIAVVGSVNLDFVARAARLPGPGETVGGATLARHPGGKGANQALAARRLGAETALHARVGRDAMAAEALALLRADGVDLRFCTDHPIAPTGVALIAVSEDGENQIVVAPGANAEFADEQIGPIAADALLLQREIPVATSTAAAARFAGFVSVNAAPAGPLPAGFVARADLLVVNEHEREALGAALGGSRAKIAVTYGARGAALLERGEEIARHPGFQVAAVDTTGAGDAFAAALTLALVEQQPPALALAFACAAGALSATRPGAQPSLPRREEVEALLAQAGGFS
jgi:ribokinase